MNEDAPKMNAIPIVAESHIHSRRCYGCGSAFVVHNLSFRVSDTQVQQLSWCNQCAGVVMNFLEERVLCVKEVGHE